MPIQSSVQLVYPRPTSSTKQVTRWTNITTLNRRDRLSLSDDWSITMRVQVPFAFFPARGEDVAPSDEGIALSDEAAQEFIEAMENPTYDPEVADLLKRAREFSARRN